MSDERERDEVGRQGGHDEPDFEGHGNRGGDQVVEKQGDGEEPDFEGHAQRGGDSNTDRHADI